MSFRKVKISMECGILPDETGIINVWWWKDEGSNEEWRAKKPIWEFLNAKETFMLSIGEIIEISEFRLKKYFESIR